MQRAIEALTPSLVPHARPDADPAQDDFSTSDPGCRLILLPTREASSPAKAPAQRRPVKALRPCPLDDSALVDALDVLPQPALLVRNGTVLYANRPGAAYQA